MSPISDRQGVSRSGLLKLGLAIVVVATALGFGISALIPAGHDDRRAPATTMTAALCAREQARVQIDEMLAAQFGPGPVFKGSPPRPPTVAQQELGKAQAKLAACVAALGK